MPIISFANTKGGSGKSTAALLLACELAELTTVTIIDADPRRPIIDWSMKADVPGQSRLIVTNSAGERAIQDEIESASQTSQFVIVDLEGSASRLAGFAISQSDLVLIPTQEQYQDAQAAVETLAEIRLEGRARRRKITAAVVFTRTKVVAKHRTHRHMQAQLRAIDGLEVLPVELVERDAFSAIFASGGGLRQLDPKSVSSIDKAIANAQAYAQAVVDILSQGANA
jgi:chromosome partitioning protein